MKKFLSLFAFLFASMMMFAGSYTLTFKDSGTSSDNSTKRTTVADIIAGNADSVKAVTATNVYQARSGRGIKLGTSGATGSLTMTLNTPVKVTSLVVNAMRYKDGEATLKIQDKSDYTLTAEAADYTYTYAEATEVSEITVASTSKRNYIISLTVNYEKEEPSPTTQDLYLKLSSDWAGWPAKYAVYYFNDTENGWSEFMTAVTGEENTYTATIPVGYSKVIFVRFNSEKTATGNWDDKWSQTVDLTIPENKNHFTVTSGGTGSECDGVWAKYPVVPTYYVAGTMTKWGDEMVEMNEGSYTFEGLAAGKYEIKVVDNNSNWLGFDKLNTTASNKNVYGEGSGNIKFVLGEEGDVTVAYDGAKITVTGSTIVAPTTVFTVTVPEGTEKAFIAGNFTKWAPVEMTLKEENVFTYSFAGDVADTASYKYLAGPDWKYVEIKADDSEADNRGYKAADEVAKWKAVPVALKYAKVTKAPINWTGHYIISFGDSKPHMAISADGKDLIAAADAPAFVDGDTISLAEGYDVEIRFSETAGAYTIKLPSEKYIKIPGSNAVNEDATAMALYLNYFKGTKQEGVQIADKNDFTSTGTRMIYKNNNNYRSYTDKIDGAYVLPTLYRLVDEAFDCQDGPYAILVNGKDVENTVPGEEFDGYKQYVAYLSLTKGDSIQLINTSCGATWLPAIEKGGMSAHFKKGVNAATIDTTGCFDLYIKMKEGDDKLYIGAGICADDTVRYYIAGEGDGLGWDAEKRIAAKQDTTVLKLKAGDYKLKVVAGENWLGFEALTDTAAGLKDLDGDDHNIGFTLKEAGDVTIVYNDTVFTVTGKFYVRVPKYKDLYLVPGVWAEADAKIAAWIYTRKEGAEMADQWTAFFAPKAEGNDTLTAKIDSEADSILFVRFNKTVETPAWSDEEGVIWNKMEADTIDYAGLTYTITGWETGTWKVYVPEVPAKFYITGDSALVVNAGLNKEKAWAPDAIKVTEDSYTFENLVAGDYKLKVTDGDWSSEETPRMNLGFSDLTQEDKAGLTTDNDNNICFTLKEAGNVIVTCKKVEGVTTFTVTGKFYVSAEPQGCDWENIEFLGDGSPEQTFGNQFKVCKEGDVPSVVNIQKPGFAAETGIYVTFPSAAFGTISLAEGQYKIDGAGMVLYLSAFTAVETEVTVVCESKEYTFTVYNAKGSAPVVEHTYTVAGDNATAFGTAWDPENAANDMVKQEDGTYKWEKAELTLAAGTVQFKVCEDHAWAVAYPASDYQLAIAEAGIYTITITFNPEGNAVNAVAAKTGSAVVIPTIAMHGNFTGSWVDTKNFTVAEDNETATLTMNLTVGNYEFGMRIGGPANWTANGVAFTLENTSAVVVAGSGNLTLAANIEGEYTFTWTYATSTLSIKFPEGEIVEPTLDNGYYIIGLNGWDVTDLTADDMFWSTGIETGEYSLNVTLAVGNEFKVVYVKDDKIETWFPEGDNYKVDAAHAGAKTIYFRPGYNGNEDWHAGCIYVAPNSDITTGINAINADAKAVKVIRNGQLLIIKGEKTYNGLGTLVR